jgi:hypothetical protein
LIPVDLDPRRTHRIVTDPRRWPSMTRSRHEASRFDAPKKFGSLSRRRRVARATARLPGSRRNSATRRIECACQAAGPIRANLIDSRVLDCVIANQDSD